MNKTQAASRSTAFKKKMIAAAVASVVTAGFSGMAFAQDDAEEIVVTGIRASLTRAMDIKRDAAGVVEGISAEDIGKMPDANLAESLQRIPGVSISRSNGEGQNITVRGIDSGLNMVTLNGRNMPAVNNNGKVGDQSTRAFDFGNLASEGISGAEIFKTGKATLTSGGLGAVVNVKTLRPLDAGTTKGSIGIKAVADSTARAGAGDKITPEASGLYNWVNEESNFGVTLTGSYQKRDNMRSNAFVSNWDLQTDQAATDKMLANATVVNGPAQGQLWDKPSDIRYALEDTSRVRKNGQLTLQYRPIEKLSATLDYTYSNNIITSSRTGTSTWYENEATTLKNIEFDNAVIKTPLVVEYDFAQASKGYKDIAFGKILAGQAATSNSIGFNLAYEVSDDFKLSLDTHSSTAESSPTLWNGTSTTEVGMSAMVVGKEYGDFRHDLPIMGIVMADNLKTDGGSHPWQNGNADGILNGGDASGTIATMRYTHQKTTIDQTRIMGSYDLGELAFLQESNLNFGIETRKDVALSQANSEQRSNMGNWGGVDPANFADNYFTPRDFASAFPDYSDTTGFNAADSATSGKKFIGVSVEGDARKVLERAEFLSTQTQCNVAGACANTGGLANWQRDNFSNFNNGKAQFNGVLNVDRTIEEKVDSVYVEFNSKFDVAGLASHLTLGARVEKTEVTSISASPPIVGLTQFGDDDWRTEYGAAGSSTVRESDYRNTLPSLDFDISPMENVKARFSVSKTLGRPSYSDLNPNVTIGERFRTATGGNPNLKPMESTNFDLSVEWYYNDDSYVSVGYFKKDVKNFIASSVTNEQFFGLKDHRMGPRFTKALADLSAAGTTEPTLQQIYDQMLDNQGSPRTGPLAIIQANESDPLMTFSATLPSNDDKNTIDGIELSLQHMFGESGFGVQVNATKVDAAHNFDVNSRGRLVGGTTDSYQGQLAMNGISDSANFTGFYDKNGFEARIAYNWRDAYLVNRNNRGNEPRFTEAFGQLDLSFSYALNDQLSFSAGVLNALKANSRDYARSKAQLLSLEDLGARYDVGVRYKF